MYKTDTNSFNAKSSSDSSVKLLGSTFPVLKSTLENQFNYERRNVKRNWWGVYIDPKESRESR